jgi:hypothetical protein
MVSSRGNIQQICCSDIKMNFYCHQQCLPGLPGTLRVRGLNYFHGRSSQRP